MKDIEIYRVPEGRRYWFIRSKGGSLYDHFITNGVIGISHLDEALEQSAKGTVSYNKDGLPDVLMMPSFDSILNRAFPKSNKDASETRKRNQSEQFTKDISVGDWVITVTKELNPRIRVGLVTSNAFVSNEVLTSGFNPERSEDGTLLRRNVDWGPEVPCHLLSSEMNSKLRAQQTISNLDSLVIDIHHYIFPMFIYKSTVYLSVNIGRPSDIPLDAMTNLFKAASGFNKYVIDSGADPATVKAYFFSEGSLRLKAYANTTTAIFGTLTAGVVFLSLAAYGNELTGVRPVKDSIVELTGWNDEGAKPDNTESYQSQLKSGVPFMDTSPLRSLDEEGLFFLGGDLSKFGDLD